MIHGSKEFASTMISMIDVQKTVLTVNGYLVLSSSCVELYVVLVGWVSGVNSR